MAWSALTNEYLVVWSGDNEATDNEFEVYGRFVAADGMMDFTVKDGAGAAPKGFVPWFDHPARATRGTPVVFGHWSTLGLALRDDVACVDTGCVWGGALTALAWPSRRLRQVRCPPYRRPGSSRR